MHKIWIDRFLPLLLWTIQEVCYQNFHFIFSLKISNFIFAIFFPILLFPNLFFQIIKNQHNFLAWFAHYGVSNMFLSVIFNLYAVLGDTKYGYIFKFFGYSILRYFCNRSCFIFLFFSQVDDSYVKNILKRIFASFLW